MPDARRIAKEIRDCAADKDSCIVVVLLAEATNHLRGCFWGPQGTAYENGYFELDILVPDNYPFQPFKIKFITPVYHPNVSSQTGAICLDILKNEWTPVLTLKTTIISVQQLLASPEPDDPQDAQVAAHYRNDREGFEKTARMWTKTQAIPPPGLVNPHASKENTNTSNSNSTTAVSSSVADRKQRAASPDTSDAHILRMGLNPDSVSRLSEMGFDRSKIIQVLKRCHGKEDEALEQLLSS